MTRSILSFESFQGLSSAIRNDEPHAAQHADDHPLSSCTLLLYTHQSMSPHRRGELSKTEGPRLHSQLDIFVRATISVSWGKWIGKFSRVKVHLSPELAKQLLRIDALAVRLLVVHICGISLVSAAGRPCSANNGCPELATLLDADEFALSFAWRRWVAWKCLALSTKSRGVLHIRPANDALYNREIEKFNKSWTMDMKRLIIRLFSADFMKILNPTSNYNCALWLWVD